MKLDWLKIFVLTGAVSFAACSSSSGTTAADDTNDTDDTAVATEVTVSGQVAVGADDVSAAESAPALTRRVRPRFVTTADDVLAAAEVELVQIDGEGTETVLDTATTDTDGNYEITGVPGCNATTDYYYEIRVTSGDLDVRAPACPSEDTEEHTVNVSPESTVAAAIISDVVDVQTSDSNPPPPPSTYEALTQLVSQSVVDLEDSIEVPSVNTENAEGLVDFANGIVTTGTDAETAFRAFQLASEADTFNGETDADAGDAASYFKRLARESCGQPSQFNENPLPLVAAEELADAFIAGDTFTVEEVVTAYNDLAETDVTVDDAVTEYAEILTHIETGIDEISASFSPVPSLFLEGLEEDNTAPLLTLRDLTAADLAADTELDADQALSLLYTLDENGCFGNNLADSIGVLLGGSLADPEVSDVEIYHDSGFGCDQGAGEGHLQATVSVFLPDDSDLTVTSVTVASSGAGALDANPNDEEGPDSVELDAVGGNNFTLNDSEEDPVCVTLQEEVTYTITATLSDDSTVTKEVTRNHPLVPEAITEIDGESLGSETSPTIATVARPVFSWTSPEEALAEIDEAPAGSVVKYTYEFSHMQADPGLADGPLATSEACPTVTSGALYSVDNFIPTVDCNVDACAAAQGLDPSEIVCRINIQTYLVDENDSILGQAAGDFGMFCVDTNADGDCGE